MKVIAHVRSCFPSKFGIPRQSGLADKLLSTIVFEPEYRDSDAFRGLEGYSHIWVLWHFSQSEPFGKSLTVRPPRLGGNVRMGVFATRSPFRPNPIGISAVRLERIEYGTSGTVLYIRGADIMDGTPVFDIKPYLPYADAYPDAEPGFSLNTKDGSLSVDFPDIYLERVPAELRDGLISVLEQDPRPAYQDDGKRVYGFDFSDLCIHFYVKKSVLTVCGIDKRDIQ